MTPTSDERREVAERLRVYVHDFDFGDINPQPFRYVMKAAFADCKSHSYYEIFARLADLIDPTCVFEPTETLTRWDENDYEHETNEPDPDCATFACSRCGYEMLYGDEYGWFDTEPPYTPHFKFCPNCSARVLPLKLYDKVVTDDGE